MFIYRMILFAINPIKFELIKQILKENLLREVRLESVFYYGFENGSGNSGRNCSLQSTHEFLNNTLLMSVKTGMNQWKW
ncbi:MAG: hypothetical protein MAG581_00280 [Deltaproteobacteria bacterium]|nr:hypothetical protein [Deltaproteobacteria bacterium]